MTSGAAAQRAVVGGDVVAQILALEGVEVVFGIVDGTYMGFFAGLEHRGIRLVSPRHETSAAHMAGAYARLTGKLGVCMASNGPGVANILPGVAVENGEGNRVLLVTSSRREGIAYPDRGGTYQYFDQVAVTRPMTKWSGTVPRFDRLPEMLRRALRVAYHGRPGVVHVDVPESILNGVFTVDDRLDLRAPSASRRIEPIAPAGAAVARAAEALRAARRPTIHAGSGVVHAQAFGALAAVAEALHAPVTTSWGAHGVLPEPHPLAVPMYATEAVTAARAGADLVLVVGSRIGETDWWGKAPYWARDQALIQVDVDEEILGLNKAVTQAVLADAGLFLEALASELAARPPSAERLAERRERMGALRGALAARRAELDVALTNDDAPLHSSRVPHALRRVLDDDAVLVIDGGNTAVWTSFFYEVRRPNTVLSTPKFGMLGAGVGQALGAKVARPEAQVCCILGDGAMGFHVQELETALRSGLAVVYVVLCDKQWGMVKLTQSMALGPLRDVMGSTASEPINADFREIAFDDVARAMGCHGERVSDPAALEDALRRCLGAGRPAVLHVDVDPTMHLFAPGLETFKAMHQEPAGE